MFIMIVLHIATIENNPCNGVCVAVPQHIITEKEFAKVGFINTNNVIIDALKSYPDTQIIFVKPFDIRALPEPYNKPDMVVFHECYRLSYLQISKNLRTNRIPYIIVPHGDLNIDAQKKKHLKKVIANFLLFNSFTNNAAAIQCLSKKELDNTHFGKHKILITNGVKIPQKRKEKFHTDEIKFLYIGRLESFTKGLDIMIEAVSRIKESMINANATVSIYGPDILGRYAHVKNLINKAGVSDIVKLHHYYK